MGNLMSFIRENSSPWYIKWDGEFLRFFTIYLSKLLRLCTSPILACSGDARGKRGEHKPRNGDRIHTSVPVYLLMVLQGHGEGVALLVVWHHGVQPWASGLGVRLDSETKNMATYII